MIILIIDSHASYANRLATEIQSVSREASFIFSNDTGDAYVKLCRNKGVALILINSCCLDGAPNANELVRVIKRSSFKKIPLISVSISGTGTSFQEEDDHYDTREGTETLIEKIKRLIPDFDE